MPTWLIFIFSPKIPILKKFLKILRWTFLILLGLVVLVWLLIQTEPVQNWLVKKVTVRISKDLNTQVSIKHVSFSLFDKMNLEGTLIRDRQKDTLLYAGKLKIRITDWFFLKDKAELKYVGLEDAVIKQHRSTDSVWNHQFLIDYFSSPKKNATNKKKSDGGIELDLKTVDLKNVSFFTNDEWKGQLMVVKIGSMLMEADVVDFKKNCYLIKSIMLDKPVFSQQDFEGKRPLKLKPPKDTGMYFNTGGIFLTLDTLHISNGNLAFENLLRKEVARGFDGAHIILSKLNASFSKLSFINDTIKTNIDIAAHERSGLELKKLKAVFKLTPQVMEFAKLDMRTNKSELKDYYAMKFTDFNEDFKDFIAKVSMDARMKGSVIHSDDIAFFSPALKTLKQEVNISGNYLGTVGDFSIANLFLRTGNNTYVSGNLKMKGLPNINNAFITLSGGNVQTDYKEVALFYPDIVKIKSPNIASLGLVKYKGDFKGTIKDFAANGTISSNQGALYTNLTMHLPSGKNDEPRYKGIVSTQQFNLGKFFNTSVLGNISFDGKVDGSSFNIDKLKTKFAGKVSSLEANGYTYHNLTLDGTFQKKYFTGEFKSADKNFDLTSQVEMDFNGEQPRFNIVGDLVKGDLKKLNLTIDGIQLSGLFDVNFTGTNIDNFLGDAKLLNATLKNDSTTLSFDSLNLKSYYVDGRKTLSMSSNEFGATIVGDFNILGLPNSFQAFLHRYYPAYINAPYSVPTNQNFEVTLNTKDIEPYLKLFAKDIAGLNNVSLSGKINTAQNLFNFTADVPYFKFKKYEVSGAKFIGKGTQDSLNLIGDVEKFALSDSFSFPNTHLTIAAANDHSLVSINTRANNTLNEANLTADVFTLEDGVRVNFKPSSFVINEKKWNLEKNGEVVVRKNYVSAKDVRFTQGYQEISLETVVDDAASNVNELVVKLKDVNMGDFTTLFIKGMNLEGVASGKVHLKDFFGKFNADADIQVQQFRLDADSIGIINLNGTYSADGIIKYKVVSPNEAYNFLAEGTYDIKDSVSSPLHTKITLDRTNVNLLNRFFTTLFSDLKGMAYGSLDISGNPSSPTLLGKVKLIDAGIKVNFTQVYYKIDSLNLNFDDGVLDLGTFTIKDTLNHTGTVRGKLYNRGFKDMRFDFDLATNRLLLLNTTIKNNQQFYGKVIGRATLSLKGPENNMFMSIAGEPTDSSNIVLPNSIGKESADADFIVFKQYGTEMAALNTNSNNNLTVDLDLTANNKVDIAVIMDEITGDKIEARGNGKLKIHSSSNQPMSMRGRYNIENGSYNFSFQSFIRKPFILKPDAGNYIEWTGDAFNADIKVDAQYTATSVKLENLIPPNQSGSFNDVKGYKGDVYVVGELRGKLSKPNINFHFDFPQTSSVRNDFALSQMLSKIQADENEMLKQVAFLVVFNSFSPYQGNAANATTATSIGVSTVSSLVTKGLNNVMTDLFSKLFKDKSIKFEFNTSFYNNNLSSVGSNAGTTTGGNRLNTNLKFAKTLANDRIELFVGSDFDFAFDPAQTANQTSSFVFLPDLRAEFILNENRTLRAVAFYKDNIDLTTTAGKRNRTGISLTYRKDLLDKEERQRRNEEKKKLQAAKQAATKPKENIQVITSDEKKKEG